MEGVGDEIKDGIANRLFTNLKVLEDAIIEELTELRQGGERVASKIHG